jgi:hypothetical protein
LYCSLPFPHRPSSGSIPSDAPLSPYAEFLKDFNTAIDPYNRLTMVGLYHAAHTLNNMLPLTFNDDGKPLVTDSEAEKR